MAASADRQGCYRDGPEQQVVLAPIYNPLAAGTRRANGEVAYPQAPVWSGVKDSPQNCPILDDYDVVVQPGRVFDMLGMLPPGEARMRMCVMQVGKRGRWTYRDWARWRFLWKFFPWYAREMRYRGDFCLGSSCMHWFWEDAAKKERGYCSAAVSRTQHMMWATEWENRDKKAAGSSS